MASSKSNTIHPSRGSNKKAKRSKGINTVPLYIAIVLFFILYVFMQKVPVLSIVLGIALFFLIVVVIVLEVFSSVHEEGAKKSALELVLAIVMVVVFWFALRAVLGTSEPLNVVPSCSMLPNLQRGDLVAISGISKVSQLKAPVVNVSQGAWSRTINNFTGVQLSCVAYNASTPDIASGIYKPGDSLVLYESTSNGGRLVQQSQQTGLIRYSCGVANVKLSNGSTIQEANTNSITIGDTTISGDINNSIIVYKTIPKDEFYQLGDGYIVHRVYAIIHSGNSYYVLTKGDNNPGLDIQYGNYPIVLNSTVSYVEGKVIAVIPYIGYLRLIFSNEISQPQGCNSTIEN